MPLPVLPAAAARLDLLALGEVMVRLSPPGHGRIEFARTLEVEVGGGEYNVAYGGARLGLRTGLITRLPDNPVAAIIVNHARAAGMDVAGIGRAPFDGLGRTGRVGLNFTEVGMGVRPAVTVYDRGHTAMALARPEDFDFPALFAGGCRWLHTGGIMAALGPHSAEIVRRAVHAAKAAGALVSFDLNYRASLWSPAAARAMMAELLPMVDVLFGNEDAFDRMLGLSLPGVRPTAEDFHWEEHERLVAAVQAAHPHLQAIACSLRAIPSGSVNHFSGLLHAGGRAWRAREYRHLEIEDRVGGGDGFCAGLIYGLLAGHGPQEAVDLGAACGALLHTTRGDTSQATLAEVRHIAAGGSASIKR